MTQSDPQSIKPSIHWRETPAADEAERFARYAQQFEAIQARKSKRYGTGRALHRKQITAAQGYLEVLGKLPAFVKHGLFAKPGRYDVLVRLSNGGMDHTSDRRPDIRGFSFKVLGVEGESALGHGPATSQDFTLINHEKFAFRNSDEFVSFVVAAAGGGASLFKYLFKRYGVLGGFKQVGSMASTMKKPFTGFATEALYSCVPLACGPYAVRVRLVPSTDNGTAVPDASHDWNADFSARMARQALSWDVQLQPYVNDTITPIEDASVNWTSPYVTVARLHIPVQQSDSPEGQALAKRVEGAVFDPWQALAAHRPLGDVQRARKVVYFQSQKGRGAAG